LAEQTKVQSVEELMAAIRVPAGISIDLSTLNKGIDHYHVDIELSPRYQLLLKTVVEVAIKSVRSGKKLAPDSDMEALRDCYQELVTRLLHRTKTDLTAVQATVLQFALLKAVIAEVRVELEEILTQLDDTLSQQQFAGSRSLMVTQESFRKFRQCYPEYLYRTAAFIIRQLQREEQTGLRALRQQFLPEFLDSVNLLFNPMLACQGPMDDLLQEQVYVLLHESTEKLSAAITSVEQQLAKLFPDLQVAPLKVADKLESGQIEIYDEFKGLFAAQGLLGPAEDQQDQLSEPFGWLDEPGNIALLFDQARLESLADSVKEEKGMRAGWSFSRELKKLLQAGEAVGETLAKDHDIKVMMAGYICREKLSDPQELPLTVREVCEFVAGVNTKKHMAKLDEKEDSLLIAELVDLRDKFADTYKARFQEQLIRLLTDFSRFRLHLRYYRLTHRIMNRLSILTNPEERQLSKSGGHLYQLLTEAEDAGQEDYSSSEIVHHGVLKADVRGSTTLTALLQEKNLNPAAYFSEKFFRPITELLAPYGAEKVFIEGDAVILVLHEHSDQPGDWYAVSRLACIAKGMVEIVKSKNVNAKQMGVPALEIGIGICFADYKPGFLYDDDRPIMISSAIGAADRMSSCSWKLRESFSKSHFNVEVLEIAETERDHGEKGQQHLRYNVNGILLSNDAFKKIRSEILLKRLTVTLAGNSEVMFVGNVPDKQGKQRELVIREGRMGVWQNDGVTPGTSDSEPFYEVITNTKLSSQVAELAKKQT